MNLWQKLWPEESRDRLTLVLAFIIAMLSGYFLFVYRPEFRSPEDAIKIGVIRTETSVRIRHAKSLRWGTVPKESLIYLKDMVYNPKGTTAEFLWKDKKFVLEPETLVQFDDATLDNLEITLLDGKIKTEPDAARYFTVAKAKPKTLLFERKELTYLPDINPLIIKHGELTARTNEAFERKLVFEPEMGVISPKLYLNHLSDYQIVIKTPQEKTYRYVENGWISFEWLPLPLNDITYRIRVGIDNGAEDKPATKTLDSYAQILFEAPGDYVWEIIAEKKLEIIQTEPKKLSLSATEGEPILKRVISSKESPSVQGEQLKSDFKLKDTSGKGRKVGKQKEMNAFELLFGK